jgi:hypothetical protein
MHSLKLTFNKPTQLLPTIIRLIGLISHYKEHLDNSLNTIQTNIRHFHFKFG